MKNACAMGLVCLLAAMLTHAQTAPATSQHPDNRRAGRGQPMSPQDLMHHALQAHEKGLWMDCRNGDPYVFYKGRVWLQGEKSLIFPSSYQYSQGVIRWPDGVIDDLHHELQLSTMQERTSIAGPFACKVVKGSTQAL